MSGNEIEIKENDMNKQVIGVGDIVIAGRRKIRGQDREYFTALIVGEGRGVWFVVDLASKKGYQHTVPKKFTTLAEAA